LSSSFPPHLTTPQIIPAIVVNCEFGSPRSPVRATRLDDPESSGFKKKDNGVFREIILASGSNYRRELLARLGLSFQCVVPPIDEEALKNGDIAPDGLAAELARLKAESVSPLFPDALIIGSDQLVEIEGRILGKPGTRAGAIEQLETLAGRTHRLITALALWADGVTSLHIDTTRLRMRTLSGEEIARYIDADDPLDCAGSYKIEARGIALFDRIDSVDHSAIQGLPLVELTTRLRALGYAVP